ncbi:MAG: 3-dehydroquinate synthase [Longimicrobiales bacterium]
MTRIRIELTETATRGYDVIVAAGAVRALGEQIASAAPAHRYAVITDHHVAQHWLEPALHGLASAGLTAESFVVDPGEASKTRETWAALSDRMLSAGLGRDSAVIALGGGVVGDLAGFVAATYLRGVPLVQVPTTLLAMIDASVGGKTGVDAPAGKNLIGAFHQPRLVIVDPETLRTLPDAELRGGLAEALKHGAIADAGYFGWLEDTRVPLLARDADSLTSMVIGSIRIKASFVAADTLEAGPRVGLNFGHTIGHALERATNYAMRHGHAVTIGMIGEATLGEAIGATEPGVRARLEAATRALGLPRDWPDGVDAARILALTRSDKKARQGSVRYTLLASIGLLARTQTGDWTWPIDDDIVMKTLPNLQ